MRRIPFLLLLIATISQSMSFALAQPQRKAGHNPTAASSRATGQGTLVTETLASDILRENRIGLDPNRRVRIYLPPGYAHSGKAYPVVYYFHSTFQNAERLFEDGNLVKLLERGFAEGVVGEFIFVAADYSTPTTGSIYENSPVSGRWLDFTTRELVPFIDQRFRTLRSRDSRALAGDFMGGRGALKLAMVHADLFSVVYALHPVATGMGHLPWTSVQIDWKKIYQAQSFADLGTDGRTRLFVTISQAFLPNPDRPPFYCDFFMEPENGEPKLHVENTQKTKAGFLLEETLGESVANLRTMRGIGFDWGASTRRRITCIPILPSAADWRTWGLSTKRRNTRAIPGTKTGRKMAASTPVCSRFYPATSCLKSTTKIYAGQALGIILLISLVDGNFPGLHLTTAETKHRPQPSF